MTERLASDLLIDQLAAEGTKLVFGNPGPTEAPILSSLSERSDIKFVLGLHEAIAVGMANGYSQASGKAGVVILHATPGLTNGLSALAQAMSGRVPLVVICGQHDTHTVSEFPNLDGDLCRLAQPFCKWTAELKEPEELPRLVRRAFHEAFVPPRGPAFLSIPVNLLSKQINRRPLLPPKLSPLGCAETGFLKRATQLLVSSTRPAIIAGNEVALFRARKELVALVEALGCPAFCEQMPTGLNFPNQHQQFAGVLPMDRDEASQRLAPYDVILMVGVQSNGPVDASGQGAIPPTAVVVQINVDPGLAGSFDPCHFSATADLAETVSRLRAEAQLLVDAQWVNHSRIRGRETTEAIQAYRNNAISPLSLPNPDSRIPVRWLFSYLDQVRPQKSIIVNECGSYSDLPLDVMKFEGSSSYFSGNGGAVGWGVPSALGMQWASSEHTVICLAGDGSMLFYPQVLWTAAHYELPLKIIVINNQGYGSLSDTPGGRDNFQPRKGRSQFVDIKNPPVSFLELAGSMGVPANSISTVVEVQAALQEMFDTAGPYLLDIRVVP